MNSLEIPHTPEDAHDARYTYICRICLEKERELLDTMLEVLKAAVEHHEWRTKIQGGEDTWGKGKRAVMPQIRAAIKQAEGEAS